MQYSPMSAPTMPEVEAFFARAPGDELDIFKMDMTDAATLATWCSEDHPSLMLAQDDDGRVVGVYAILPDHGWSRHVGQVVVLVDPQVRGQGLGRTLTRRAVLSALDLGLEKIIAELLPEQESAIEMFTGLGFYPEALLRSHVRDRRGQLHDLVVLSHEVRDNWEILGATGIDAAVAE